MIYLYYEAKTTNDSISLVVGIKNYLSAGVRELWPGKSWQYNYRLIIYKLRRVGN